MRSLSKDLDLKFKDQTMAVYPATLAPPPYLYPYTMDREKGIKAYQAMVSAEEHKKRVAAGDKTILHRYENDEKSPVISAIVTVAEETAKGIIKYEFQSSLWRFIARMASWGSS